MAKENFTGRKIKEWIKDGLFSCFLGIPEEEDVTFIPTPLIRQNAKINLFEGMEGRLDEVNARNNFSDGNALTVAGSVADAEAA